MRARLENRIRAAHAHKAKSEPLVFAVKILFIRRFSYTTEYTEKSKCAFLDLADLFILLQSMNRAVFRTSCKRLPIFIYYVYYCSNMTLYGP
jgi:hypothetical protein